MINFNGVRKASEGEVGVVQHREMHCPRLLRRDCPIGMYKVVGKQVVHRDECCETYLHRSCSLTNPQGAVA